MRFSTSSFLSLLLLCLLPSLAFAQQDYYANNNANAGNLSAKYLIQPTDLLQMTIYQEPDMATKVRVQADGSIDLPFLGRVFVGDMTINEAQNFIQRKYDADYFVNPQVSLLILEYQSRRVYVFGMVNQPGWVPIPPEEQLTLTRAIAGANGFNLRADKDEVQIRRVGANGDTEINVIDVEAILQDPALKDPYLKDGDTVFVPESFI